MSAEEGGAIQLTSTEIYSTSGFAWVIPSQASIITSSLLVDGTELSSAYKSATGTLSVTSAEISSIYSIEASNGTLTVATVTSSTTATAIGATVGNYFCYSSLGTMTFTVSESSSSDTSTSTVTTTISADPAATSAGMTLEDISIYYIVLGAVLFVVILVFIYLYYRTRVTKKVPYRVDIVRPINILP